MLGAHTACSTECPLSSLEKQKQPLLHCSFPKRHPKDFLLKVTLTEVPFKSKQLLFMGCWALTNFLHKKRDKVNK